MDGRINNNDAAAPVVVYGIDRPNGRGLIIYAIDADDRGYEALLIEPEQIASIPNCPTTNTLIGSNSTLNIMVYRLTSCEFQVNAFTASGKLYTLIFTSPYPNIGYTSFESLN